jgi:hypothetical protein
VAVFGSASFGVSARELGLSEKPDLVAHLANSQGCLACEVVNGSRPKGISWRSLGDIIVQLNYGSWNLGSAGVCVLFLWKLSITCSMQVLDRVSEDVVQSYMNLEASGFEADLRCTLAHVQGPLHFVNFEKIKTLVSVIRAKPKLSEAVAPVVLPRTSRASDNQRRLQLEYSRLFLSCVSCSSSS